MRDIPGFSNYLLTDDGQIFSKFCARTIKAHINKDGYLQIKLRSNKHQYKLLCIHQIVCLVYYGICPKGMEVRHLDGDKLNNVPSNLVYGSKIENVEDRSKHHPLLGRDGFVKRLTVDQVKEIKDKLNNNVTIYRLAKDYGINRSSIRAIRDNKTWKYVHLI